MTPGFSSALLVLVFRLVEVVLVSGHGRLVEPPSRSTMWRYGFPTPHNYNDHEVYCGGFTRMMNNGGRCGVCGDAWDDPTPRANEDGGKYGNGIIVREYRVGQVINVTVDVTANHMGHFEFRLCPANKGKKRVTDECMDKYKLHLADGSGIKYKLPSDSNQKFSVQMALPKYLTCSQCVLQWTYVAGNNWGTCPDGRGSVGCGPQETFRACADVAIFDENNRFENDLETNEISEGASNAGSSYILLIITMMLLYLGQFLMSFTLLIEEMN